MACMYRVASIEKTIENNKYGISGHRKIINIQTEYSYLIVPRIAVCRDHVYVFRTSIYFMLRKCLQGVVLLRLKTMLLRTSVQG